MNTECAEFYKGYALNVLHFRDTETLDSYYMLHVQLVELVSYGNMISAYFIFRLKFIYHLARAAHRPTSNRLGILQSTSLDTSYHHFQYLLFGPEAAAGLP